MVTRQRRVTKAYEPVAIGAVFLAPGWTIEIDGKRAAVQRIERVDGGPKYDIHTDQGTFRRGASQKVVVVQTN